MTALPTQARRRRSFVERGGVNLVRLFGVDVRLDWSVLIIFALITFNLGTGVLPGWHPDWSPLLTWALAVGAALLFFASLLAHELSHAFVGRALGLRIEKVTLFLFGGVAHLEEQPRTPKAELLMAAVGPLVSLALGAGSLAAGLWLAAPALAASSPASAESLAASLAALGPGATLLLWLGPVNLTLGLFNLVPGFPLDGGRVLRAAVWAVTGDVVKATRWAAGAGQVAGWGLMGLGALALLRGGLAQGLWLLLIGWFLANAARTSLGQVLVRRSLQDVPVLRVMQSRLDRVAPELSLDALVREHLMAGQQRAFPVEVGGALVGLVCLDDVRKVPQARWASTPVSAVMTPAARLAVLPPEAGAEQALDELGRRGVEQIPILDHGHLLGLVRREDLVRWLSLQGGGPLAA